MMANNSLVPVSALCPEVTVVNALDRTGSWNKKLKRAAVESWVRESLLVRAPQTLSLPVLLVDVSTDVENKKLFA